MTASVSGVYQERDARVDHLMDAARASYSPHQQRDHEKQAAIEYLQLANAVASRFRSAAEDAHDLRQVAYVGLMKALQRFDPSEGRSVASFAVPTIVGEIKRFFRDSQWPVRAPRVIQETRTEIALRASELEQRYGREVTCSELAAYLGRPAEVIAEARRYDAVRTPVAIDECETDDPGKDARPLQFASPDGDFEAQVDVALIVSHAVRTLTSTEQTLITLRFRHELSQGEIARELGISQMQVSRLLVQAFAKMRLQLSAVGVVRFADVAH